MINKRKKGLGLDAHSARSVEFRAGNLAPRFRTNNAMRIEFSRHVCAISAKKSIFYPVLIIHVSLMPGQEDLRDKVAERIKNIIDELIPE